MKDDIQSINRPARFAAEPKAPLKVVPIEQLPLKVQEPVFKQVEDEWRPHPDEGQGMVEMSNEANIKYWEERSLRDGIDYLHLWKPPAGEEAKVSMAELTKLAAEEVERRITSPFVQCDPVLDSQTRLYPVKELSALDKVSANRMLLHIKRSISEILSFFAFEVNDELTRRT